MFNAIKSLFSSRKFLVAAVTFLVSFLVTLFPELEAQADTLIAAFVAVASVLIGGIAYEDGQEKRAGETVINVEMPTAVKEETIEGQG